MLDKLRIEFTRSRPRHSNDNGLAETKNGAVVRKEFGYEHIHSPSCRALRHLLPRYLNPFLNFHRPCLFATELADPKKPGRIKRLYRAQGRDDAAGQAEQPARRRELPAPRRRARWRSSSSRGHSPMSRPLRNSTRPARRCSARCRRVPAETRIRTQQPNQSKALWTCGRCADAHRRSPWTTLARCPPPAPSPTCPQPSTTVDELLKPGPQYTVQTYNGSTCFASSISGRSRLIPDWKRLFGRVPVASPHP